MKKRALPSSLAASMAAKANEHERIQRELQDIQARAESELQSRIAKQWVENNAAGIIPKIEAIAVQGGRHYCFGLHPDSRYTDCSGAWGVTFREVKTFFEKLGFSVKQDLNGACASTTVRILW
jgi:hypothetical protein